MFSWQAERSTDTSLLVDTLLTPNDVRERLHVFKKSMDDENTNTCISNISPSLGGA